MAEPKPPQDRAKIFDIVKFSTLIIIIAACGLLRYGAVLCVLLASVYLYIMSRYVFPLVTLESPPSVFKGTKALKAYFTVAYYIGLYLPLAYITLGVAMGDKNAVQMAATHTFSVLCQGISERISFSFSLPARALVPILYNAGRIVCAWAWIQSEFLKGTHASSLPVSKSPLSAMHWVLLGRSLAVANLLLWSFNLFGFLVPVYLPICFRKYFEEEKAWSEQSSKTE